MCTWPKTGVVRLHSPVCAYNFGITANVFASTAPQMVAETVYIMKGLVTSVVCSAVSTVE